MVPALRSSDSIVRVRLYSKGYRELNKIKANVPCALLYVSSIAFQVENRDTK